MTTKTSRALAALALIATAIVGPVAANAQDGSQEIRVGCQRYALTGVIWDRPTGRFLEDLIAVGYDPQTAVAIGEIVCRDERLVGDDAALGQRMRDLYASNPPGAN